MEDKRIAREVLNQKNRASLHPTMRETWIRVSICEGKKRQVRRMFNTVGHCVSRLVRTKVGPIHIGNIEVGMVRELAEYEIRELRLCL